MGSSQPILELKVTHQEQGLQDTPCLWSIKKPEKADQLEPEKTLRTGPEIWKAPKSHIVTELQQTSGRYVYFLQELFSFHHNPHFMTTCLLTIEKRD